MRLREPEAAHLWGLILLSGCVSFLLNLANFLVTKYTSAVALQVCGSPALTRAPTPTPNPSTHPNP